MYACVVFCAFLLVLCLHPGLIVGVTTGVDFVTAFLVNIASYYPAPAIYQLLVSSPWDYSDVNVTIPNSNFSSGQVLMKGQMANFSLPSWIEIPPSNSSLWTVRVTSNQSVAVVSNSQRASSTMLARVDPISYLGTNYSFIFPAMDPAFQAVIINAGWVSNVVYIQDSNKTTLQLQPYQNVHIFGPTVQTFAQVQSDHPVAVLLGHNCWPVSCSCNFVSAQLPSSDAWGATFILPFGTLTNAQFMMTTLSNSQLLSSTNKYVSPQPASVTVVVPGAILPIIPVENWSSSYLVNTLQGISNFALVVANTSNAAGVLLGSNPVPGTSWQSVDNTEYSFAQVDLGVNFGNEVLWHPTSRIAVYMYGMNGNQVSFASMAVSLKVLPGYMYVINKSMTWTEALEYCQGSGGSLLTISDLETSTRVTQEFSRYVGSGRAWFGLRQSLLNGAWYWLTKTALSFTQWASGNPNTQVGNLCASFSLETAGNFTWKSQDCCISLIFSCFSPSAEFPLD